MKPSKNHIDIYDNIKLCPNCGSKLTYVNGIYKCTSCEYRVMINEIDYSKCCSRLCTVCGQCLTEDDLQVCQKCKEKMLNNWRNQNESM